MNADTIAMARPSPSASTGAGARFSVGGGGRPARGGAVTVPLSATSIVAARALSYTPKPFVAVTTPVSFPKAPFNVVATGRDST